MHARGKKKAGQGEPFYLHLQEESHTFDKNDDADALQ